MKGVGEPQGSIKAGKIVRSQRPITQSFAPEILAQARTVYEDCQVNLVQVCQLMV